MHPIQIPDLAQFEDFQNGKQVTVSLLMTQRYLDQIEKDDMRIEVWYKSTFPPSPHHVGKVLSINGSRPFMADGALEDVSMTIQKI